MGSALDGCMVSSSGGGSGSCCSGSSAFPFRRGRDRAYVYDRQRYEPYREHNHEWALLVKNAAIPVIVEYLTYRPHDINLALNDNGHTALHEAVMREDVEMAQCLIEHGIHLNSVLRDNGQSPLHLSCRRQHFELCHLLCLANADPWIEDKAGRLAESYVNPSDRMILKCLQEARKRMKKKKQRQLDSAAEPEHEHGAGDDDTARSTSTSTLSLSFHFMTGSDKRSRRSRRSGDGTGAASDWDYPYSELMAHELDAPDDDDEDECVKVKVKEKKEESESAATSLISITAKSLELYHLTGITGLCCIFTAYTCGVCNENMKLSAEQNAAS